MKKLLKIVDISIMCIAIFVGILLIFSEPTKISTWLWLFVVTMSRIELLLTRNHRSK